MNEIEKLKTEHARYEKALELLSTRSPMTFSSRHAIADAALNPPPPSPVTLEQIQDALRERNKSCSLGMHTITIFSDGSGHVSLGAGANRLFSFGNLHQALELIKT